MQDILTKLDIIGGTDEWVSVEKEVGFGGKEKFAVYMMTAEGRDKMKRYDDHATAVTAAARYALERTAYLLTAKEE